MKYVPYSSVCDNFGKAMQKVIDEKKLSDEECKECGMTLSKEDMKDHDDIDCLDYAEMMRKYNYILG